MNRLSTFTCLIALVGVATPQANAALIVDPPQPITHQVSVQLIQVFDDAGSNPATAFGDASQRATIESLVDQIWAQAGIDINFLPGLVPWNNNFARIGDGVTDPRPDTDLDIILNTAEAQGITNADPNVLNLFFVERVPLFSWPLPEGSAAGAAFLGDNGIALFVGDDLLSLPPGQDDGLEIIAAVAAHEIGHNLNLDHVSTQSLPDNLMNPSPVGQLLVQTQIDAVLSSGLGFVQPVPEPSTWALLLATSAGVVGYRRWRRVA